MTPPSQNSSWYYDPNSILPHNGITVICPQENINHGSVQASGPIVQLPHTDIILGSVLVQNNVRSYTDWQLHGHQIWISGNNEPRINHKRGIIKLVFPAETVTITYQYASSPGRWIRMNVSDYIPASWFLTGDGDESDKLCWYINIVSELGYGAFIDLPNGVGYTQVIELPHAFRMKGRGSALPGLKLLADKFFERLRLDVGNYDPVWGWATEFDSWVVNGPPFICHKPNCKSVNISNLRLDGGCYTAPWSDIHDPNRYDEANISRIHRESTAECCFGFNIQNGRPIKDLQIYLDDVRVQDFIGSCLLGSPGVLWHGNVSIGTSVSGTGAYYVTGDINITGDGRFRRTWKRTLGPIRGKIKYQLHPDTPPNPWPENEQPLNLLSLSNVDHADVRHGGRLLPIELDVDLDTTGTGTDTALTWQTNCRIRGMVNGLFGCGAGAEGAYDVDIDLITKNAPNPSLSFYTASLANYSHLNLKWNNVNTTRNEPVGGWSPDNFYEWSQLPYRPIPSCDVRLKRTIHHSPEHVQKLRLTTSNDYQQYLLFNFPDLAACQPHEVIPTEVILDGCVFQNKGIAKLVGVNEGHGENNWPTNIEDYPVKLIARNCRFHMYAPGPFMGDNFYPQQFKLLSLQGCTTHDGMVSEQSGKGEGNGWYFDIPTKLMWKPLNTVITPLNNMASDLYDGYKWIVLNDGATNEDSRRPSLRIYLKAHTNNPLCQFSWSAQVSP